MGKLDPAPVHVGDARGELRADQVKRLGQLRQGRDRPDQVTAGGCGGPARLRRSTSALSCVQFGKPCSRARASWAADR